MTSFGSPHPPSSVSPDVGCSLDLPQHTHEDDLPMPLPSEDGLVERYIGLVVRIAESYAHCGVPLEDMIHEGVCALLEAARRYQRERNVQFVTYATPWIRRAIYQSIRDYRLPVSIPERTILQWRTIRDAQRSWYQIHGREPTPLELSEMTGISERVIRTRLQEVMPVSVPLPLLANTIPEERPTPESESSFDYTAMAGMVTSLIEHLPEQWRTILVLRFGLHGEAHSLREIAALTGVSHERVRQITNQALEYLRKRVALPASASEE